LSALTTSSANATLESLHDELQRDFATHFTAACWAKAALSAKSPPTFTAK
jgi:hypothetical protein